MLVIGAKGFAKELLSIIYQNNSDERICFYDDISSDLPCLLFDKYEIINDLNQAKKYLSIIDSRFVLGVGNPLIRFNMMNKFTGIGGNVISTISISAKVGNFGNEIGIGTNIMNNVIIETSNTIGRGCIIHNNAFISHDINVGDFCEISPSVSLLGNVTIGSFCSIGTGAIILPKIKIGDNVVVGAGAVVTKNIPANCLVFGTPAKLIRSLNPLNL